MSMSCNTCGASISVYASEEELKKFVAEHLGDDQPAWHREKRKRDDEDAKRICEKWVRRT